MLGAIPLVGCQEHGRGGLWAGECFRSLEAAGWKCVGAQAALTEAGGRSGGVLLAVPECLGLELAPGQDDFDISPAGCAGRACMALVEVGGGLKLVQFVLYLWTGESLRSVRNATLLDAVVAWITKLRLPWVVTADWQNEPAQLAASPWNKMVRGAVLAPEDQGGTCRNASGEDRVIDYFWADERLAGMLRPAQVIDGPYSPHRPVALASSQPWRAYRVKLLARPRAFPTVRPTGCQEPPPAYPALDGPPSGAQLDSGWEAFCELAEGELLRLHGIDEGDAAAYQGRGKPLKFVWRQQLPRCEGPLASSGPCRAWRWVAKHMAWLIALLVHRAKEPGRAAALAPQTAAVAKLLTGEATAWRGLGRWRPFVQSWAHGMVANAEAAASGCVQTLMAMQATQQWVSRTAGQLERQLIADRENAFREKLAEDYPGSGGLLHRVTKWRAAWAPPTGSISKAKLPLAPQAAAESEADCWADIWQAEEQHAAPMWRSSLGSQLEAVPPVVIRSVCKAYKTRTGLGGDFWHPRQIGWLSDDALRCLADLWGWCEVLRTWPVQVKLLILFLLPKDEGGARPIALLPTMVRLWEACRAESVRRWELAQARPYD